MSSSLGSTFETALSLYFQTLENDVVYHTFEEDGHKWPYQVREWAAPLQDDHKLPSWLKSVSHS